MKKIAKILVQKRQEIISIWEEDVLQDVLAAKDTNLIALHDHIPNILDDIVEILNRHPNPENYLSDKKIGQIQEDSIEHGRHRATTSNYTVDQIIHEYMIFYNVVNRILIENRQNDPATLHLIKCCIDKAMLNSVKSFTESIQEMQNKLVGTLAHDIRNPLAAARMAIEMLDYKAGEERFKKVKKMSFNCVNKSIDLVEGLLDSITVRAGEGIMLSFSELNLYENIKTVYEEACDIFDENIVFECEDKNLKGVYDATAVRRLLENLISNAFKYGDSEKPITINVNNEDEKTLKIMVHNFGNPIPREKQKGIFDFLTSEKQQRSKKLQSYGIGLTLVKMVAEAHSGFVELKSEKVFGTQFSVTLKKNSNQPGKIRTKLNATA